MSKEDDTPIVVIHSRGVVQTLHPEEINPADWTNLVSLWMP